MTTQAQRRKVKISSFGNDFKRIYTLEVLKKEKTYSDYTFDSLQRGLAFLAGIEERGLKAGLSEEIDDFGDPYTIVTIISEYTYDTVFSAPSKYSVQMYAKRNGYKVEN